MRILRRASVSGRQRPTSHLPGRPIGHTLGRSALAATTTLALTAAVGAGGVRSASADVVSGTVYTVTSVASGRVMDEPAGQTSNGTPLQIWDSNGGTNQQWRFNQNGDGSYTLTDLASGRVLDEPGGQTANGTRMEIWDSNGGANQHWRLSQNGDGSYTLTNLASGRVLDEPGGQTANGTPLQIWDSNGGANQHWNLTPVGSSGGGPLPSSFRWQSSGVLISPKSDARHNLIAVKDPSVVYYNGRWHVFASTVDSSGNYNMEYLSFTDWSQANSAQQYYLDQTPIGGGYKTAPMVFYFAPQKLWYLVYQTGSNASYSTNSDISNPAGWSAPHGFYTNGMPAIIRQNIGNGYWVDMWVICDSANCYLFSADDNGHIYRSTSSIGQFPNGFGDGGNTVIAASAANRYDMFEADNVYKVDGSNTYLMIVEAIGSDGHRLFHSWTSSSLTGSWTPLAATQTNPFLAASNTTFSGAPWTQDFSSGEAIRSGYDQNVTISPCHLQYLYQGKDPSAGGNYNLLPWRIGLATQTNSAC